jgi:hypothetical protein
MVAQGNRGYPYSYSRVTMDETPPDDPREEALVFDATCTDCGQHLLIFPSQITGMTTGEEGIRVEYTCWCGADQTWSATSRQEGRDLVAA